MKLRIGILVIVSLLILDSCNFEEQNFEKDFYESLSKAKRDSIVEFNLANITDFKWDKLLFYPGNESVPIYLKDLKNSVPEETEEIKANYDRFYFFEEDNLIKKFDVFNDSYSQQYIIVECHYIKVDKTDCVFKLKPNVDTLINGTIVLYPKWKEVPS